MIRDRVSTTMSHRALAGLAALTVLLTSACSAAADVSDADGVSSAAGVQTAQAEVVEPVDVPSRPSRRTGVAEQRIESTELGTADGEATTGADGGTGLSPTLHRRNEQPLDYPNGTDAQWLSMEDFMYYVLVELDSYWSSVFADNGLAEPWVSYYFPAPGEWNYSACTDGYGNPTVIDDTSLFYCPVSERIVVSQQIASDIWTGTMIGPDGQRAGGMIGDFAVAMMLAHEFGHHIQDELGLLGQADTPTLEQHADCLAGVWTAAAERIGILDPGDVDEGLTAAWLVGDSAFDAADHHGTSDQRMAAFATGYSGGGPSACDGYVRAGLA
jgi:predicted metalloprotease